jgi:site-specific DNA recombinase
MTTPLRAAIYARYSTDKQDRTSCEQQFRKCREFAVQRGFNVVAEYQDAAHTGSDDNRPGYQAMLAASAQDEFDCIIAHAPDRLTRNSWELLRLLEDLVFKDQQLLTCDGKIDSSDPNASLLAGIHGGISAEERKKIAAKTKIGLDERFEEKLSTGGVAYGYAAERLFSEDPDNRRARVVIDKEKARIVLRIFKEYAAGASPFIIAAALNTEGVPSPGADWKREKRRTDGKWQKTSIREMLDNERYIGNVIFNRYQWRKIPGTKKRRARERPRDQWLIREEPGLRIVPQELWDKVRARRGRVRTRAISFLKNGRAVLSKAGHRRKYLFSGLLKCAECGCSLTICDSRKYGCGSHINGGDDACEHDRRYVRVAIEQQIVGVIRDRLLSPARMERFKRGLAAGRAHKAAPAATAADRIAALDKKIGNYAAAIGEGLLSAELKQRMAEAERERQSLKSAPVAPVRVNVERVLTDAFTAYRRLVDDLAGAAEDSPERGQAVMAGVFEAIPVDRHGRATVTLDVQKMLSFVGAALPRGLVGSGGRI